VTPFLAFVLGLLLGLAVAGGFWFLGYRLARVHDQQVIESNILSSQDAR
jgi:hypothetical protein